MFNHSSGPPRSLIVALGLILVLASVFIVACSSSDDSSDNKTTAATATGSGAGETAKPTSGSGTGGDASADLSALATEYENFTGVVKYTTTGLGDSFSSMKIYKGKNASRVDYESSDSTGSIITTADAFYLCGEGQCIKYATGNTSLDPTAGLTAFLSADAISSQYADIPAGVDVEKSSTTIAGVDATCYKYSGDVDETEAGDESGEICFSESGLLLRLQFNSASGGGTFEATEANDTVSDSDFEPPFPVTEIPNIGQ